MGQAEFSFLAESKPIIKKGSKTLVAPPQHTSEPKLTNVGYAVAADMGLLVAKLLLEACRPKVEWMLVTKPKRDSSYHLPVLTGIRQHNLGSD